MVMQVRDLYAKYNLMPQLITHQLRVGGIVRLITDDRESILTALVHDMGNMAKFSNLDTFWTGEQEKFWNKYGKNAHEATIKILEEAGLPRLKNNIQAEADFYRDIMIIEDYHKVGRPSIFTLYGDSRVTFEGVVPLEERTLDLETRYSDHKNDRIWGPKLEKYVQSLTTRDITRITEADVVPLFDELLSYQI